MTKDITNTTKEETKTDNVNTDVNSVENSDSASESTNSKEVTEENTSQKENSQNDKSNNEERIEEKFNFKSGDTVSVHYKITEGNKTRIQPYQGIVIAKKGKGMSKTFTVRRIGADNVGVERIFPLFSPNIEKVDVLKRGKVRRSKLYYLRHKIGKAAMKVKELGK